MNSNKKIINEYKKKDTNLKNEKINNINLRKRYKQNLNTNYDYINNLTQNYNYSNLKYKDNEYKNSRNNSIKKNFNKSISLSTLQDLKEKYKKNIYEFEEPFDLSCLFIVNTKLNEYYNTLESRFKKLGINYSQKNNCFFYNKNGDIFKISIIKFNNNITKNKNNNGIYPICYKVLDKGYKNKKINEIIFKLHLNEVKI